MQERLGVRDIIEPWARKVVRTHLPDQHRDFYSNLPFVVASARDRRDRPWISLLTGLPGFVESPDPESLVFKGGLLPGDALEGSLGAGSELGLLGIELETRRRNRVNGTVTETGAAGLRLEVAQAFGNCPQYITEREWRWLDEPPTNTNAAHHSMLTDDMQAWIAGADTFFIGSGHRGESDVASNGMDASHRGGPAGFVRVSSPTQLVFPDYAGNNHFNTLGNLVVDPRVGLLFVDFENGNLLQLTGRATIDWDSPKVAEHTGAKRLVIVDIDEAVELVNVLPLRFLAPKGQVRELRLVERQQESNDVVSFYFESRDGGALPDFEAGQHLPLEIEIAGRNATISRTYTLSNAPGGNRYRISVKREEQGLASRFLHDSLEVGSIVSGRSPAGDFVVGHHDRPIVLLSAGIGVTPMISMLHELTAEPTTRPIHFLHAVRNSRHHPLADEARSIVREHGNVTMHVAYSQPLRDDAEGRDFDIVGRLDEEAIREALPDFDAEYYLCGPPAFLTAMTDSLSRLGVPGERIRIEQF